MSLAEPRNKIIDRRSAEWEAHYQRQRWLQDSLEGGDRYRYAEYGKFAHSVMGRSDPGVPSHFAEDVPSDAGSGGVARASWVLRNFEHRNLIRHPREYPMESKEGEGDDYLLRLERTPIPAFVPEVIETHLSKIFAREVDRDGPQALKDWWDDVEGQGDTVTGAPPTTIDEWMTDTLGPTLLVLGQIDVLFDHPPAPDGEEVATQADVKRLGLDRCTASMILPENMVWWKLGPANQYLECLVQEYQEDDEGVTSVYFRHWTAENSTLYDADGELVKVIAHPFGRVPIIRIFDRKKQRCKHIGQSRYEAIAERQREYYNADSELILANTLQVHPLLQAPEELFQSSDAIPIGPGYVLQMKKHASGDGHTAWEVLDFPTTGVQFIEQKLARLRDEIYQHAKILKPAGAAVQGSGQVVAQSGVSKQMDQSGGNDLLSKIAKVLEKAEKAIAEMVLMVLANGDPNPADVAAIRIAYPSEFDLYTAEDLSNGTLGLQKMLAGAGALPVTEGECIKREARLLLPGLADDKYVAFDEEIDRALADKAQAKADAAAALADARTAPLLGSPKADPNAPDTPPTNPLESVAMNAAPVY